MAFGGAVSASENLLPKSHDIEASAGPGGSIDPSGTVEVERYYSQTFTITPDQGYEIEDVVVDGDSQGPISSYTFYFVRSKHEISATFIRRSYTITASSGEGGEIKPVGEVIVDRGDDQGFEISANPGYEILDVIVDDDSQGAIGKYAFTNVLSDHTISAEFERVAGVRSLSIPDEAMKVGDPVRATISVGDDGGLPYVFVSGSVAGYTLQGFERINSNTYEANFTILEGGDDYAASDDIPVSDLVISNGGVEAAPYNSRIVQSNDPIDANSPLITRMTVLSSIACVGDTVILTIYADGADYAAGTGTVINGIPLSSPRVWFSLYSDGIYDLHYLVGEDDMDVDPGMLQASVVLQDEAGNTGSHQSIDLNSLEIYTELPQVSMDGRSTICRGQETVLTVRFQGRPPWSFDLDDGESVTSYNDISAWEYEINMVPFQTTTYSILSVRDLNGKENTENESFDLFVDEAVDVEIINLGTIFNVDDEPILLEASVPGGVFSGPGVASNYGYFNPAMADTVLSPHSIRYTYTNLSGCISLDSQQVYVVGSEGSIIIPENTVCKHDDSFHAVVSNVPGIYGLFSLLDSGGHLVNGLLDHGDNTASIVPDSLVAGIYTIEYHYEDVTPHYLRKDFVIEHPEIPRILDLTDPFYCSNASPFVLRSDNPDVVFEGPGVTGNVGEGYLFEPSLLNPGDIVITCTAVSQHGCRASSEANLIIKATPEAKFTVLTECLPEGEVIAYFENQTAENYLVETWYWDFGDPESGEQNHSEIANPQHLYSDPGSRTTSLIAVSYEGCSDTTRLEAVIEGRPEVDFDWISDCLLPGRGVKFLNRTNHGMSVVDTIIWTFKSTDGILLGELGTVSVSDTVSFLFAEADTFLVDLYARNSGSCEANLTRTIVLRAGIDLGDSDYREDFDDSEGMWLISSDDQEESWVWGVPEFPGYTGSEDDKAWFTRFPAVIPGYMENSWIESPCYDLSSLKRPVIRLDIMRSLMPYLDGAVLQYQDDSGGEWRTVGDLASGIEWYGMENLVNLPGGSNVGWGSEIFEPDSTWVSAMHDLDEIEGKSSVSFRIAIASNGRRELGNQGFALNNVQIAERTKFAVLEHFTNSSDHTSMLADSIIDAFSKEHSKEVIDLQYHMAYPGYDWMNYYNPGSARTRSGALGVSQVPFTILDGAYYPKHQYSFQDLETGSLSEDLSLNSLREPEFAVDLNVKWEDDYLEATTTSICKTDRYDENIQLYVVVFEKWMTTYAGDNGDSSFRNVVLGMLPNPGGKMLEENNWSEGEQESLSFVWPIPDYVEDIEELAVAAFLQDRNSGKILQAAVVHKNELVSVPKADLSAPVLTIYPNPAGQYAYVKLGARSGLEGRIEITDMSGKLVHTTYVSEFQKVIQLDIASLSQGMYFLRHVESGRVCGVSKLVKLR